MKFEILLLNEQGTYTEHELTLPVGSDIHWDDFVNLRAVKDLLLANPNSSIIDITPEDIYEDILIDTDDSFDIDGLLHNG
jgi:hypothetical protein